MSDSTLQYLKSKEDILDSDIVVSQFPDEFKEILAILRRQNPDRIRVL